MPTFIVKTHEDVEGTYSVEAASEDEARAKFASLPFDWEGVTQLDYMAYECKVDSAAAGPPGGETPVDRDEGEGTER